MFNYILLNGTLYHHGIKGQKWGIRNGPPYPLNEKSDNKSRYITIGKHFIQTYGNKKLNEINDKQSKNSNKLEGKSFNDLDIGMIVKVNDANRKNGETDNNCLPCGIIYLYNKVTGENYVAKPSDKVTNGYNGYDIDLLYEIFDDIPKQIGIQTESFGKSVKEVPNNSFGLIGAFYDETSIKDPKDNGHIYAYERDKKGDLSLIDIQSGVVVHDFDDDAGADLYKPTIGFYDCSNATIKEGASKKIEEIAYKEKKDG